jgi:hypothetical protein
MMHSLKWEDASAYLAGAAVLAVVALLLYSFVSFGEDCRRSRCPDGQRPDVIVDATNMPHCVCGPELP